jgi:hypothetical protein
MILNDCQLLALNDGLGAGILCQYLRGFETLKGGDDCSFSKFKLTLYRAFSSKP